MRTVIVFVSFAPMSMDRSSAKKWTIAAQGFLGVGVLALAGAALMTVPGGGGAIEQPPAPGEVSLPSITTETGTSTAASAARADGPSTAARLQRVANHPKPAEVAPTPTTPVEIAPAATGPSISYLGCVHIGTRKRGLIGVDGRQRFVGVGDKVSELAVEAVEETHIMIGGKRYDLPDRAGSVLSRATNVVAPQMLRAMPAQQPTKVSAVRGQNNFGAAPGGQGIILDGFLRVPEYVDPQDATLWRRIRAELIESNKHGADDLNRIAAKMIDERRENSKEDDRFITPEQRAAERRHFEEFGDGSKSEKGSK